MQSERHKMLTSRRRRCQQIDVHDALIALIRLPHDDSSQMETIGTSCRYEARYEVVYCMLYATGLCPDWPGWDLRNNVMNATEAMDVAEQWLSVPQVSCCYYLLNIVCG